MTEVMVTTAGLVTAMTGAKEPFGAVMPATGVCVVAATVVRPALLWAKETTTGEMISAAPSRAATRCLRRMLEGDMVVLSGRELIQRRAGGSPAKHPSTCRRPGFLSRHAWQPAVSTDKHLGRRMARIRVLGRPYEDLI